MHGSGHASSKRDLSFFHPLPVSQPDGSHLDQDESWRVGSLLKPPVQAGDPVRPECRFVPNELGIPLHRHVEAVGKNPALGCEA
jgi:hypothetical protein